MSRATFGRECVLRDCNIYLRNVEIGDARAGWYLDRHTPQKSPRATSDAHRPVRATSGLRCGPSRSVCGPPFRHRHTIFKECPSMPRQVKGIIMRHTIRTVIALLLAPLAAEAASLPVSPFPRNAVRLTPSVWLDAQKRDGEYLLSLEPDRLLYCFRVTAGLPAPGAGGRAASCVRHGFPGSLPGPPVLPPASHAAATWPGGNGQAAFTSEVRQR